jgi:DNA-binding beta-propeller fold protein YncE
MCSVAGKILGWCFMKFTLPLLFLIICGCASKGDLLIESERLVWPSPPMEEKIEWVAEYKDLSGQNSNGNFWQSFKNFILGSQQKEIVRPYGISSNGITELYIADTGASAIHIYNMDTFESKTIEGNSRFPIKSPIGVAYYDRNIYFTDSAQAKIFKYDLADERISLWAYTGLERPTGIAVSAESGQFYVVDTMAHQVISYDRLGVEKLRFGTRGTATGKFNFPTDIAIGPEGDIYITDSLNARIQVFSHEGVFLRRFGQAGDTPGNFAKPKGIGVDRSGNTFVCDALFDAIQVFDSDGQLLLAFGDNGVRRGQFWMPSGIYVDKSGNVFVADTYNRRIQQFRIISR